MRRFALCSLILLVSGSYSNLYSQINATVTQGCAPLASVGFSTTYNNPTNILWDFGGGSTSLLPNPTHSFANAGIYLVTFTATVSGSPVNASITITVFPNPQVSFTVEPTAVCAGAPVQFQSTSTGGSGSAITGWEWSVGGGAPVITGTGSPSHTYANPGSYNVTLIATDANGCQGSQTLNGAVTVSTTPTLSITPSPSPLVSCAPPFTVNFTNNSTSNSPSGGGLTHSWNFGNGETSTAAVPPAVTYSNTGVFTVTYTATDNAGCSATQSFTVTVQQPVADFFIEGAENGVVCADIVIINNGTPGFFNYGDGTSGTQLTHTYNAAGVYTVTLNINVAGCSAQATQQIEVEIPTATIINVPGFSCSVPVEFTYTLDSDYDIETYDWQLSNNSTSTDPSVSTLLELEPNEYSINGLISNFTTVSFTTTNGCPGFAFVRDSIALPNALFYPNLTQGCAPLTVNFEDHSQTYADELITWVWHYGDGATLSESETTDPTHTYMNPGEYEAYLIVTNGLGCVDTSYSHIIEVGTTLNPSFTLSPQEVCWGESVQITNTSNNQDLIDSYSYAGDNNTLFDCTAEDSPEIVFDDETGNLTVTQTVEYNGCLSTSTQNVTVNGPVGKITYDCNCDTPLDYTFNASMSGADNWTWNFGDGTVIENSTSQTVSHSYTSTGNYEVTLTSFSSSTGCLPYVDITLVKVRQLEAHLNIPERACAGIDLTLSAAQSVDVGNSQGGCYRNYLWYFGDNSRPVKTINPTVPHAFLDGGVYEITLFVKDDNECVSSTTSMISIYDIEAAYTADTLTGCPPFEVNFSDLTAADTTIVSWSWNFGNNNFSTEPNPTNIYDNPTYNANNNPLPHTVSLTVTDVLGCTSTINNLVIQPLGPNPNFIPTSPTNICAGDVVTFAPNGSNPNFHTYVWEYGNGETTNENNGSSVFNEPGSYTIHLTVTDTAGCSREQSLELVTVQAYPVAIIDPSFEEDEVLCYPVVLSFTDVSEINPFGSRNWDLGIGGAPLTNVSVGNSYLLPGLYEVELIVRTTFGCSDTTIQQVFVQGPLAEIDLQPFAICPGGSIELNLTDTVDLGYWEFDFGDGTAAANQWPTFHDYDPEFIPASGQTLLTLVMYSPDSVCASARTISLIIEEVIAGFDRNNETAVLDSVHCFGTADIFTNTSSPNATGFNWNFSTGQIYNTANPPTQNLPPGEHTITLIVSSNLGCQDTIIKQMEIFALPEPTVNDGEICKGETIQLTATGGVIYQWSPPNGLDNPSSAVVNASPAFSQYYNVLVIDTNDCSVSVTSFVDVFQPSPSIERDTILRIGDTAITGFYLGEGYTYLWTPNIELECDTCAITTFRPLENTLYTLTVSDTLGCFSIDSYFYFEILEVASVDLPNAFTPNGDGINDIVFVRGWGIENLVSFRIFNRWGEMIFETADLNQGWDGTYKGVVQNPDSYAYIVVVKNYIKGTPETFKGYIDLIR